MLVMVEQNYFLLVKSTNPCSLTYGFKWKCPNNKKGCLKLFKIADYDPLLTMIHSQFNLNRDSAQSASHDFPLELGGGYHVLLLLPITILICFETIILLSLLSLPATVIIKYFFFHHNEWGATFPLPHCLFPFWSLGLHHFPMKLSNYA